MANPFVHVELNTHDIPKAKEFYGRLFDWAFEEAPNSHTTYTMIRVGEGTGGGMMRQLIPDSPSAWMPYMQVDDVISATARAEKIGGRVMKGVTEVAGSGWFSILEDPTGAIFGLWQSKED